MVTCAPGSGGSMGLMGNGKFNILKSLRNILGVNKWWNVRWARGATGVGGTRGADKEFP